MNDKYILALKTPIPVDDLQQWGRWIQTNYNKKHVAKSTIDDAWVSTIFLGLDHRFFGEGGPILFETMIFGGKHDQYQNRCCTWTEAEEMHKIACDLVWAPIITNFRVMFNATLLAFSLTVILFGFMISKYM